MTVEKRERGGSGMKNQMSILQGLKLAAVLAVTLSMGACPRKSSVALGPGRANPVRTFLASGGIGPSRLRTISSGKKGPVAVGNDISCWSQNRRAVTVLNASS